VSPGAQAVAAALLLACGLGGCRRSPTAEQLEAERVRLTQEKLRLEHELRVHARENLFPPSGMGPEVEVVVAVPTSLVKSVVSRTVTEALNGISLRVNDVKLHVEQELRTRVVLSRQKLGDVHLDLTLRDVHGTLAASEPRVTVKGGRIHLEAPVRVTHGHGRARLRFRWKGHGLAKAVCGDLDVTREVEGTLIPTSVVVRGGVAVEVDDAHFVVDPAVPAQKFRLRLELSKETWIALEQLIAEQREACRFALRRIDLPHALRSLLREGIEITVHTERIKTARLPLEMNVPIPMQGQTLVLSATPAGLRLREPYIWFGLDVSAVAPPASAERTPTSR
jgi:hypothetical protein